MPNGADLSRATRTILIVDGGIRMLAANDWRRVNPRFQDGHLAQNLALADAIV